MTSMTYSKSLQQVSESISVTVESRLKNKSNLKPYWNNLIENISKNLWLPKKLNSESLNINSWFSVKLWNDNNQKSLEKIINQSAVHSKEYVIKQRERRLRRTKKICFYPTSEQKSVLKQWFGTCRYFYNKTLHDLNYKDHDVCYESPMHQSYVEPKYPTTNYIDEARRIFANVPDWAKDVPYQSKRLAIKQCCDAVKNAKIKYKKLKQIQKVKFKSKRNTKESIYIPKSAVSALGVYHTKLGQLKFAEEVKNAKYDCRLLLENGQYFLVMPYDKVIPNLESQKLGIVALDCGVRTFQTFYNPELAGKFGHQDFNRIYRLCYAMDNLISKTTKVNAKKRKNMKKALARIRIKIKNLISEVHHKSALFFAKHFDAVVIPPFETSDMVTKLVSKVARSMLGWSHYKFQQILKAKCEEFGTNFILQNEAYTSKTCSSCGHVHKNLGSKKVLKCKSCGVEIDRDINGARGIYLRALGDNPSLITN